MNIEQIDRALRGISAWALDYFPSAHQKAECYPDSGECYALNVTLKSLPESKSDLTVRIAASYGKPAPEGSVLLDLNLRSYVASTAYTIMFISDPIGVPDVTSLLQSLLVANGHEEQVPDQAVA